MNMRMMDDDGLGGNLNRSNTAKLTFKGTDSKGKHFYVKMTQLDQITYDPQLAWIGSERQATTVRARFPHARKIPLVRQSHKPTPR